MRLARIVKWDSFNWWLDDGTEVNPPIGTVVQVEEGVSEVGVRVYFPGYNVCSTVNSAVFNEYFEWLE